MSVKIIVDSAADLILEIKDNFTVVPLTVRFGEEEFIDGVTIDHKAFYEKLIESDVIPTTSQPTPAAFEEVYSEIVSNGDTAVVITLSSQLSGTYQSATIAAADYEGSVFVVDSKTIAVGMGVLAEYALGLVDEGKSAKEIADILISERENVCLVALLDTLEYLKKGGRISKTVAFAGGLLNIKPVAAVRDGKIEVIGKARGSKQANNYLVSEIEAAGGVDFSKPVLLGYTGLSDITLQKYIEDSAELWKGQTEKLKCTTIGCIIGTHAGPGAIGVAFFKR